MIKLDYDVNKDIEMFISLIRFSYYEINLLPMDI